MTHASRWVGILLVIVGAALSDGVAAQVYKPSDPGVTMPAVETAVRPQYTPEAIRERIQGSVWIECIVLPTGRVDGDQISVSKSLDLEFGLDQQAVDAARQWTFKPGTRDGKAVAVSVTIELSFTLK